MTFTSQLARVQEVLGGGVEPVTLLGSSLGGLMAVLTAIADPRVARLFLMAPAFKFMAIWLQHLGPQTLAQWRETGVLEVYHYAYGCTALLGYKMVEDAQNYDEDLFNYSIPVQIVHGLNDAVVPPAYSVAFAQDRPNIQLTLVPDDHSLLASMDTVWDLLLPWLAQSS